MNENFIFPIMTGKIFRTNNSMPVFPLTANACHDVNSYPMSSCKYHNSWLRRERQQDRQTTIEEEDVEGSKLQNERIFS